jgi:hypothetical protein
MKKLLRIIVNEIPSSLGTVLRELWRGWTMLLMVVATMLVGMELGRQGASNQDVISYLPIGVGIALGCYIVYHIPLFIFEIMDDSDPEKKDSDAAEPTPANPVTAGKES